MQIMVVIEVCNNVFVLHSGIDTDQDAFGMGLIIDSLEPLFSMFNAIYFETGNMQAHV